MDKIDFVLIWVDDSDPEWQKSYARYSKEELGESRTVRYRDWGTLRYWFRGVERFAPWVNKIFFITCGHVPEWLNLNHPKLRFVKHSDYIPQAYLPTFNSHTIELNLHRIEGLADRFVYFNDDTFIIDNIATSRFFKNGAPCDMACLNAIQPLGNLVDHVLLNNITFCNRFFNKREVVSRNFRKWINLRYGSRLLRTMALMMYPHFTGFVDPHLPNPFLKKTLSDVWNIYGVELDKTCRCKFRTRENVSQYIFRYYQLLKGEFYPINPFKTSITYPSLNDEIFLRAVSDVSTQAKPLICINDGDISDFEKSKAELIAAFDVILPDKSGFEV